MKRSLIATIAFGMAACLGACGGDPTSDTTPSTSASTSPSSTSSADPGDGPPTNWESKFTPVQLTAVRNAMDTWDTFRPLLDAIYRQGKLTPGAKATLQRYDFNWQRDMVDLGETYDKGGLRLVEGVVPLWSYAQSVKVSKDGTGWVAIVQCTDYRPLRYTRNGKPQQINKPKHLVTSLVITMTKPDTEHGWMHEKSVLGDEASCSAE